MVMEDKDYVEPKKTNDKDTDNENDIYEIVDDLGFLGNVEQEKMEVNTSKEKEIKDKWDKIAQEEETWEQKQMASLQKVLLEMKQAPELNLAAIEKISNLVEETLLLDF